MKRKGRTSMDKTLHVLKMKESGYSINGISKSLKMCTKTVCKIVEKANSSPPAISDRDPLAEGSAVELGQARPKQDLCFELPPWLLALDWEFLIKERLAKLAPNSIDKPIASFILN